MWAVPSLDVWKADRVIPHWANDNSTLPTKMFFTFGQFGLTGSVWDFTGKKNFLNEQHVSASLQFLFDLEGRSGKTQINLLSSQEKELKVCGCFYSCTFFSCFSHSVTVYPLNLSIYPSVSNAQSCGKLLKASGGKRPCIFFPSRPLLCTLLNYFLCSYK